MALKGQQASFDTKENLLDRQRSFGVRFARAKSSSLSQEDGLFAGRVRGEAECSY